MHAGGVPHPKKDGRAQGALSDWWIGPRYVKKLGPVTFDVLDLEPPDRTARVHVDNFRPYVPPSELDCGKRRPAPKESANQHNTTS